MSETFNPLNEEQLRASQQRVVRTAQDLISGSQPFIDAVRKIVALRFHVAASQDDPDFTPFVALDSETDHLPPESAMAHCTDEWKAQSAKEVQSAILLHGPTIFAACERLIQRFAK